jgi:hypothetical protein
MEYPKNKVKSWNALHVHGDSKLILERFGISYYKTREALKGIGDVATFKALDLFYKERVAFLNQDEFSSDNSKFSVVRTTEKDFQTKLL